MLMITLYLTTLFIAPQLWIPPFVGLPVDFFLYPAWFAVITLQGRLSDFFRFRAMDWFFAAMLIWIVISAVVNTKNANTASSITSYIKYFVLYRLIIVSLPTMIHIRKTLWLVLFFVMVLVVEGIKHKLSPDGIGWAGQPLGWVDRSVLEAGGSGRTQWIAVFDGPGVFCVAYTIGLPVVLMFLGKPYGWAMRILGFSMIGPLLLAIYYTGSRGGFLATLGVVALFLMFRWRVSAAKIGVVCALIGGAYLFAPSHLTSVRDENKSAQNRVAMWVEGVEMVQQNPFFGIGKGNFGIYTSRLIAHNSAIEIMGETGIPGLFLWVSLIYLAMKGLYYCRVGVYDVYDKASATAILLIAIGYVLSSMFVTLEYETQYMVLGLCGAMGARLNEPVRFDMRDFKITAGMTLCWIVAVKVFVMLYF